MKICKKCGNTFKSNFVYEGKRHIFSSRKYCLECSPFKKHNTKILEKANITEKLCHRCNTIKPISEFYRRRNKKGDSYYCKPCTNKQTIDRQRKLKDMAIEYKGGCCSVCGYKKCKAALTFHHTDPSKKDFTIAHCALTSFKKVKPELDKCILVCYNCHMEIHYPIEIPPARVERAA